MRQKNCQTANWYLTAGDGLPGIAGERVIFSARISYTISHIKHLEGIPQRGLLLHLSIIFDNK